MRLAAKTASYGVVHICVAISVAYALTGELMLAVGIGLLEPIVQMAVFPLHDWVWERRRHNKNSNNSNKRSMPCLLRH